MTLLTLERKGRSMRVALSLVALLLLPPGHATATTISAFFFNSDLTFGTVPPDQFGFDLDPVQIEMNGIWQSSDWDGWTSTYQAFGGPLVQQTLVTDAGGTVTGSEYLYEGGTFQIDFMLERGGELRSGSFVAPIVTLEISAGEGDGGNADAFYVLGPGLFDASIADAFGIRRRTKGGQIFSDMGLTDNGNRGGVAGYYDTPERQAWDGATWVDINAPEPTSLLLLGTGGLGVIARLRRRKHRA